MNKGLVIIGFGRFACKLLISFARFIVNQAEPSQKGARFLSGREMRRVVSKKEKGLIVDGKNLRLSLSNSFTHLALIAPTGAGKTSRYIIPNVLGLDDCSMVITDPS